MTTPPMHMNRVEKDAPALPCPPVERASVPDSEPALDDPRARLYHYYRTQRILPTFADLKDEAALEQMAKGRYAFLRDKLRLPLRIFQGLDLLEFGPDSGEHALIFAGLGAKLTLVEPNLQAHARILAYFERFQRQAALEALLQADVEGLEQAPGFDASRRFSMVVAEGFIYTIQPNLRWLEVFSRLLRPDGLALFNYYERLGGMIELTLRALHAGHRTQSGLEAEASAEQLFSAKWDAIPHTRRFSSWVMDVLENPFVRRRTFISAGELLADAAQVGLHLYSSWPLYEDALQNYWHKKVLSNSTRVAQARAHTQRASLGYVCGIKAYDVGENPAYTHQTCERVLLEVDRFLDHPERAQAQRVAEAYTQLAQQVASPTLFVEHAEDRTRAVQLFRGYAQAFEALANGQLQRLRSWCQQDASFISEWGMPYHASVLRKSDEK